MDTNFNESHHVSHSRSSVIVRKSSDEGPNVQNRSHQWSSDPYYRNEQQNAQGPHRGIISPPSSNFPSRFPSVIPNQRSPYFQNVNHYSRRNDDRLTFHSYQNYNTPTYPSSGRSSGSFPPSNSMPAEQMEPNMPNWAYTSVNHPHAMSRPQQKVSPPKSAKAVQPQHYSRQNSYTTFNRPPTPPSPSLDLPSEINLSEFEERLAQPSALLKKFATESLKTPTMGKDPNNQSIQTPSKAMKIGDDSDLRIDIDEIFSKFSHLANYSSTSQEENVENSALLSDGSLSPTLEKEVESPIDSDKFFHNSKYNSPVLKEEHEFNYHHNNEDLNSARHPLTNEKQDYCSNNTFRGNECDIRMRSFEDSNANEQNEESLKDELRPGSDLNSGKHPLHYEKQDYGSKSSFTEHESDVRMRSLEESNSNELNDESLKDEKRPVSDCHVCGDRAIAHMHYGGICCYSCKAFFRRAVQNGKDKTYKCKKDMDCEVSVNTRRGCQKCRFEKCKEIGMTNSWVLSDEQCEIRFGKGKQKRKTHKSGNVLDEDVPIAKLGAQKMNYTCNLNLFTKEDELTVVHMMCVYEASKEMIHFSDEHVFLSDKIFGKTGYSANEMNSMVSTVIKKNIFFMSDNPFFKKLTFNDRKKLLSKNMTEMCHVRGALRFNVNNKSFQWYSSSKDKPEIGKSIPKPDIGEDAIKTLYSSTEAAREIMAIIGRIASLCLPTEVILILMHVVVFSGDGLQLDNMNFINETQVHYLSMLYRYLLNKLPTEDVHKNFSQVMAVLVELRESGDKSNKQKINSTNYSTEENESSSE
eukprot:GFUD01012911.1.p1 GENE.GFUD01012911.1~~GFUD01012911.1.p1  ORF type:complete len:805 (+),score=136.26 GFUD01012911.1:396-2810(+)